MLLVLLVQFVVAVGHILEVLEGEESSSQERGRRESVCLTSPFF